MKEIIVVFALLFTFVAASAQVTTIDIASTDTTSKLPTGTYAKGGNILIGKGYRGILSSNKRSIIIFKMKKGGLGATSGSFSCFCAYKDKGSCNINISGTVINCYGDCSECVLMVTIDTKSASLLEQGGSPDDKLIKWKRVVLPTK
jgi:hypothetical protein